MSGPPSSGTVESYCPIYRPHRSYSTIRFRNQFAKLVSTSVCSTSIGGIGGQLVIDQGSIWRERANKHRLLDGPVLACSQRYLSGSCQKIRYERVLKLMIEFLTGHMLMGRMESLQGWCICDYDFISKRRRPRCKDTACKNFRSPGNRSLNNISDMFFAVG